MSRPAIAAVCKNCNKNFRRYINKQMISGELCRSCLKLTRVLPDDFPIRKEEMPYG